MNDIYKDLKKIMDSMPKNPLDGQIVLIPAERIKREVEAKEINEKGEEIAVIKTESFLVALPSFRQVESECRKANVDYCLSECAPQKDKEGNPCIYTVPKQTLDLGSYSLIVG